MCVCVNIYVYVRVNICLHIYVYIYTCKHMCQYLYINTRKYMYTYIHVTESAPSIYIHTYMWQKPPSVICMYVYTFSSVTCEMWYIHTCDCDTYIHLNVIWWMWYDHIHAFSSVTCDMWYIHTCMYVICMWYIHTYMYVCITMYVTHVICMWYVGCCSARRLQSHVCHMCEARRLQSHVYHMWHVIHTYMWLKAPSFIASTHTLPTLCNTLQRWSILQHTATYCNILQHTAKHCNEARHHCLPLPLFVSNQYRFEQIDPQTRVLNYCFQ